MSFLYNLSQAKELARKKRVDNHIGVFLKSETAWA
jgi:hypothetical protein